MVAGDAGCGRRWRGVVEWEEYAGPALPLRTEIRLVGDGFEGRPLRPCGQRRLAWDGSECPPVQPCGQRRLA